MKALYEQVYHSLKKDIAEGKYNAGDRIPSEKELSDAYRISRITSKKALEKLVEDGIVYRQRGRGTFVSEKRGVSRQDKKQKPLFGLIVTDFDDSYSSKLISSIETSSDDQCLIILKQSFGFPEKEEKVIKELLDYGVDGLIIYPAQAEHYSSEILKMVVDQFPLVLIDRAFKGVAAASISTDNVHAAKMGMDYLFELDHQQIGILSPTRVETTTIEDRFDGIVQAYAERNVMVNRQLWCKEIKSTLPFPEATPEQDIEIIKNHLQKYPDITALFALEYKIAVLAKRAVEQAGMRVPEDVSILCFDELKNSVTDWTFTHLKQEEDKIGERAVTRLLDMVNGECSSKKEYYPARLVEGHSTCRIPFLFKIEK
ncbi:GntR family transcriptional regulator [Bacillus sp. 165]|uniref:GntR family transcriptional regulator n=1 Tax=Bacillus sp. 165 TaxID=1529117 RepID=UPI001ADBEFCC|nr:GntR family transcriptional regulator [Bacillus sp. 165]MBO9129433.1 GntR family transcriptional regulator [Bacillus sp. 165]